MIFLLFLPLVAVGAASNAARDGAQSLRLPIKARDSSMVGPRDDPGYGLNPLRINATQRNYLSPYTVEVSIGWPPQTVYLALDIFSSDIWTDPDCNSSLSVDACCDNGNYDPYASFSSDDLDCSETFEFTTTYGSASGCYVVDRVQFAGALLGNIQVGVANESWAQTAGRIGLGFGCHGEDDTLLIDALKAQGLIATRQFSIALGSANPSSGSDDEATDANVGLGELLFSGLNTRKYAGELRRLQSHPAAGGDSRHYVQMTALGIFDPNNCLLKDMRLPSRRAFFDFTTIISYLPWVYMDMLTSFFPDASYNYTEGVYQVPCYHRFEAASVDFYFDTLVIRVPSRDFILQVDGICYLGAVESAEQDEAILGQSFLRGAYTAFDLDDEAIYMAQYENCGDQLLGWDEASDDEIGSCVLDVATLPPSSLQERAQLQRTRQQQHRGLLGQPRRVTLRHALRALQLVIGRLRQAALQVIPQLGLRLIQQPQQVALGPALRQAPEQRPRAHADQRRLIRQAHRDPRS
ncbi:hypothetical protein O1611_g3688 [Lasiodiplodia mahajangana]|uniref:Uncharacterized protein n=1 Tax=Lasiodiplodia mahajangana TaxID=1108764 RepID=A0ACC2JRP3_9PEZI|nr:hypothetical protein O1611_g3688 [Lasiodiplodia mahajangana]